MRSHYQDFDQHLSPVLSLSIARHRRIVFLKSLLRLPIAMEAQQFPPGYLEQDHGDHLVAAASIILVLTTVCLALRMYARHLTEANYGWEDGILSFAWICIVGACVTAFRESHPYHKANRS